MNHVRIFSFLGIFLLLACGDNDASTADAAAQGDSGHSRDSGSMKLDSGHFVDASEQEDSGAMFDASQDATTQSDGAVAVDSGVDATSADSAIEDDGIASVRAAAVGEHDPAFAVRNVTVTYIRPEVGVDPAGFFVQTRREGPALFVAVDPDSLRPEPEVGDVVDFDVTQTGEEFGQHRVLSIENYVRDTTGTDITPLIQDVSAETHLVPNLDNFESELITTTGLLSGSVVAAAAGSYRIQFVSDGELDERLQFRAPLAIYVNNKLRDGCRVRVTAPLWRFNDSAQVQPVVDADISEISCPTLEGETPDDHGDLVITEVFYDDGVAGEDLPFEWVELLNTTETRLQLYGCALDDDPDRGSPRRIFEAISVPAGEYVVFGGDMAEANQVARFGPGLNNGGDRVRITCGETLIDAIDYDTFADDPSGASLQLNPLSISADANDDGSNWCVATASYGTRGFLGTPGRRNSPCIVHVK